MSTQSSVFDALDRMDVDGWARHLAEDVVVMFANRPPVHGVTAAKRETQEAFEHLNGLHHHLVNQWEHGDTSIFEMTTVYDSKKRGEVSLPAVTILRTGPDGLIVDYRIYMDPGPAFL